MSDDELIEAMRQAWLDAPFYEGELMLDSDLRAMRAERAEQEAAGLRAALEAITRRAPIMGSTGPYREGQLDALEACRKIASAALEESK